MHWLCLVQILGTPDDNLSSGKGSQLCSDTDSFLVFTWSWFWSIVDENLSASIRQDGILTATNWSSSCATPIRQDFLQWKYEQ